MKSSTQLDYPATWNEICDAISFSFLDGTKLGCTGDADREMEALFSDRGRILAEDLA